MLQDQHIQTLRSITSIEALVAFVRRDLGWPIEDEDIEAITYEFQPEELGLKPEHFPKINSIRQLRPPSTEQPWGIFFIDFENKKIPLTVMRRILNHLALSRKAKQSGQAWNPGDLLFLTTYGEQKENAREVAFAHFHETPGDLPTLKVIQWDQDDTPGKLKNTYDTLRTNLQWPEENTTKEAWRHQWAAPFKHKPGHVITTAKQLAEALATLSKSIRDCANELLAAETENGPLTKLFKVFRDSLIHDLKPEDFSDTFAQTISYGLLTAAISRTDMSAGAKGTALLTEDIANLVPITNPFLKESLDTFLDVGGRKKAGMDFDELGVQDVVELLRGDATDLPAVLRDFGNQKQGEDPVINFYEDYLKAYNKELKVKRGVFYTPKPVVSYIVRSVHELLQTEFGLEDGLASTITWGEMAAKNPDIKIPEGAEPDSHFVTILDPATGTGTFLVEVIDVIWKHLQAKWAESPAACWEMIGREPAAGGSFPDFWNDYVADHLLPRLYGYELMMAPYAIAHMKLGLKLGETGYRFATDRRVRVYLTNALEPAHELAPRLIVDWEALAHEALAVKAVKETQRFTVVIGNPPYSGHSANASKDAKGNRNFIGNLVHDYYFVNGKPLGEKNPKMLQDDYVKFMRYGQFQIEQAGLGALSMITNHGFLDNPTFRGMRRSLMQSFDGIRFLDLHGNARKKEVTPSGKKDENVFDIQQGVAVALLVRITSDGSTEVLHADSYGLREQKYSQMAVTSVSQSAWTTLTPVAPFFLHIPQTNIGHAEYEVGWKMPDTFPVYSTGIDTARDALCIAWTEEALWETLQDFAYSSPEDAREKYHLGPDTRDWQVALAQADLTRDTGPRRDRIVKVLYRPFDVRFTYFTGRSRGFVSMPRGDVMRHMVQGPNMAVLSVRKVPPDSQCGFFSATRHQMSSGAIRSDNQSKDMLFPLYTYPTETEAEMGIGKEPNLSPAFLDAVAGGIGRLFESGGSSFGHGGLFAADELLMPNDQPALGDFGDSLGPAQGSLGTGTNSEINPNSTTFSPEDVFHYIYAVLHSPTYRTRYAEFLKIDFPRIPLPGGPEVFDALIPLGERLVALHLMEASKPDRWATTYRGPADPQVEKVTFTTGDDGTTGTVWLDKAQTRGFKGVPVSTWNFHIGGYQVCEKWLKDRGPKKGKPGRTLTPEDIEHYHYIAFALTETQQIMKQIDEAIESHGGWPGAFQGAGE